MTLAWSSFILWLLWGLSGVNSIQASQIGLADWCINVDGSVDPLSVADNPSNACNGGANSPLASVDVSGFDQTLEDGNNSNGLGSINVNLGPGLNQYVSFYSDYDVDYNDFGSVDDFGSAVGFPPPGVTYELDDPNQSSIFFDFATNTLNDMNNVAVPGSIPQCCNVAWALAIGDIDVLPGNTTTVTFSVSLAPPVSPFFLSQTNQDTNESIYLSATSTPEPATVFLLSAAILFGICLHVVPGFLAAQRKMRVRKPARRS